MSDSQLEEHLTKISTAKHPQQPPKKLQLKAAVSLIRGRNTFLLAATGFGKTRVAEMFFDCLTPGVVVLMVNPLDALGDNQVSTLNLYKSKHLSQY